MLSIKQTADGVILSVKALAAARKTGITGLHAGALKLAVTQAPEKGKANLAIQQLIADLLGAKRSQIELVGGETASRKQFLIRGLTAEQIEQTIAAVLEQIH
jgi:uncharacterized protein